MSRYILSSIIVTRSALYLPFNPSLWPPTQRRHIIRTFFAWSVLLSFAWHLVFIVVVLVISYKGRSDSFSMQERKTTIRKLLQVYDTMFVQCATTAYRFRKVYIGRVENNVKLCVCGAGVSISMCVCTPFRCCCTLITR